MDRRERNRFDRIEYRSPISDDDRRDQRQNGQEKDKPQRAAEVDRNAKTLPIWRNGPPDELYPDDDRRS